MAIAVTSSVDWAFDEDYDGAFTSGTFSPGADTLVVVAGYGFDSTSLSVSNSGTALTWSSPPALTWTGAATDECLRIFYAWNSSAQSNITVTVSSVGGGGLGYPSPGCRVMVLSGVESTGPVSWRSSGSLSGTSGDLTSSGTSSDADNWYFCLGMDTGTNGSLASSNGTIAVDGVAANKFTLFRDLGAAGTSFAVNVSRGGSTNVIRYLPVEIVAAATATTHEASATPSTTVTATATAALSTSGSATRSTTATLTAAAVREAVASASLASSVGITAAATVERVVSASLSSAATLSATAEGGSTVAASLPLTATFTAAADVESAGQLSAAAAVSVSAGLTAAAVLTHGASASLAVTVFPSASAAASVAASASIAVSASLAAVGMLPVEATRGLMAGIERASSTMTPITGAGSPPRRVSLLSFDTATMSALVSMTQVPGLAGVPVFIGGSESPEAAGLVAAGTAYLWISDGVIYYEDGG